MPYLKISDKIISKCYLKSKGINQCLWQNTAIKDFNYLYASRFRSHKAFRKLSNY